MTTQLQYSILENSLHLLEAKSSAAISKMKTLYTTKRPLDGVGELLTFNLLNFLNELINIQFLEQSIIIFIDIKMNTWCWSANSIQPGQTVLMCKLSWHYTGGKS